MRWLGNPGCLDPADDAPVVLARFELSVALIAATRAASSDGEVGAATAARHIPVDAHLTCAREPDAAPPVRCRFAPCMGLGAVGADRARANAVAAAQGRVAERLGFVDVGPEDRAMRSSARARWRTKSRFDSGVARHRRDACDCAAASPPTLAAERPRRRRRAALAVGMTRLRPASVTICPNQTPSLAMTVCANTVNISCEPQSDTPLKL